MNGHVLCAIDLDSFDPQIVELAASLATTLSTELDIVHVTIVPEINGARHTGYSRSLPEILTDERRLKSVRPTDAEVKVNHHHLLGMPREELLRLIEESVPQLVVVGTHGRHGLTRLLLGSVAEYLLRHATCPVVILRLGQTARSTVQNKNQ